MSLEHDALYEQRFLTDLDPHTQGQQAIETHDNLTELQAKDAETFDLIREKSWKLLMKRLDNNLKGDPGRKGMIEDTHLIRLALGTAKLSQDERKLLGATPNRTAPEVNILQIVHGLPQDRAKGLLVTAIRDLEAAGADAAPHREALTVLVGPDETGRLLAIETTTREDR